MSSNKVEFTAHQEYYQKLTKLLGFILIDKLVDFYGKDHNIVLNKFTDA